MKRSRLFRIMALAVGLAFLFCAFQPSPCLADGIISLNQYSGTVGTSVSVSGSGFDSSLSISTITLSSGSNSTAVLLVPLTNSGGVFTAYFTIPTLPKNNYTVTFSGGGSSTSGNTTGRTATAPNLFTINPSVSLDFTSGQTGSQLTVNGNGFAAGPAKINLYLDSSPASLGSATLTSSGTFGNLKIVLPETSAGGHTIVATDSTSNTANVAYTIRPKITVSTTSIEAGTQVKISGKGFTSSSPVRLTLDGFGTSSGATTNEIGSFFDCVFPIPSMAGGVHILKVIDANGNFDSCSLTTTQSLTISPQSGQVGTRIIIKGVGFGAGKNISITFKGQSIATNPPTVVSDNFGNFNAVITVPPSASGIYPVSVSDAVSTGSANFTLTSTLKMDQVSGSAGCSIPINGDGFTARAAITVKYDGVPLVSGKADDDGTFSLNFKVPPGPAGQHKITVSDGIIPVSLTFTSTASVQISDAKNSGSQITGNVGSPVTVIGCAYVPGATVDVTYDSTPVASASVNKDGSFSAAFKVPVSKVGKHTVTASDGTNSVSCVFLMDSIPLPVPDLTSPSKGARASASPAFSWSQVHGANAVTYSIQIARDSAFNSIVLQKTGLASNSFQLPKDEKLQSTPADKPYYWRVMAIDSASNESLWSSASTFSVGIVLPSWIPYVFYASSGLVLFGGGFFLGSMFEFDPTQLRRLNYWPALKELFSKISGLVAGRVNFTFLKRILKKA